MQRHQNTIDEMAQRLRSAGRYDNALADRVQSLSKFLEERADDKPFHPSTETRKPGVEKFADSREQLVAVTKYRIVICPADIESCLTMATLLHQFEKAGIEPPTIRHGAGGFVVAEWDGNDGGSVMIQHGFVFWECMPKKYINFLTKDDSNE